VTFTADRSAGGPGRPVRKVVVVALTPRRHRAVEAEAAFALDHGVDVHLLTVTAQEWPSLDPRMRVHELRAGEEAHPLRRVVQGVVLGSPRAVLGAVASMLARTPAAPVARRLLGVQRGGAEAFQLKVFEAVYRPVRPYVLWRVASRQVLPAVGLEDADQVIMQDAGAITLGWHLARRNPDLDVSFTLDRSRVPRNPGAPGEPAPIVDAASARAS
jgi:hypothetical protein